MKSPVKILSLTLILALCFPPVPAQALGGMRDDTVSGNTPCPPPIDDTAKTELTSIFNLSILAMGKMFSKGDQELWDKQVARWESLFKICCSCTDGGEAVPLVLESLDSSQVDIFTPGEYTVTVNLGLDEEYQERYILPENLQDVKIPVKICDPDIFEIWVNYTDSSVFQAIWNSMSEPPVTIEYLQSGQPFADNELASQDWNICPEDIAFGGGMKMRILRSQLVLGHNYYFRVICGEMESNILHIVDDGTYFSCETIGGHRDGSGSDGIELPDVTQPAPTQPPGKPDSNPPLSEEHTAQPDDNIESGSPAKEGTDECNSRQPEDAGRDDSSPRQTQGTDGSDSSAKKTQEGTDRDESSAKKTQGSDGDASADRQPLTEDNGTTPPPMETVTATEDVLSGVRLLLMMEENGCVRFSKQGITVTFPAESLEKLDIHPEDSLRVSIARQPDLSILLSIWLNDIPVENLGNIQVLFPCQAPQEGFVLTLTEASGDITYAGSYSSGQGIASFVLACTGNYVLGQSPSRTGSSSSPIEDPATEENAVVSVSSVAAGTSAFSHILAVFGLFFLPAAAVVLSVLVYRQRRKTP